MEKLKQAIVAIVQVEADTWATFADLADLDERHNIHRLVTAFNEIAGEDDQIDLVTDVRWR